MNTTKSLSAVSILLKKREGIPLSKEETEFFIRGITDETITDYQASAFLMASFIHGLQKEETSHLTQAMVNSGEIYDLSEVEGPKVDKHSTGGVGDKVSLILAPLAAACGVIVPMMSGRGLGHSGGTLDKLESIPGFNVFLSRVEMVHILKQIGCAMIGQSKTMVPADKKLYSLRDVTATVESIPLITASILSKKKAEGAESLVLDVKVGNGAFMSRLKDARALSRSILSVSTHLGLPTVPVLTNMDQPLGHTAGNALEVIESVKVLRNESSKESDDLKELSIYLTAHMVLLGKLVSSFSEAKKLVKTKLEDGSAYEIFEKLVSFQGGDLRVIQNTDLFEKTESVRVLKASRSGWVHSMDTRGFGEALVQMGGGRQKVSDEIDPRVGFYFEKKVGDKIKEGDDLVKVHCPSRFDSEEWIEKLSKLIKIKETKKERMKVIVDDPSKNRLKR